MYSLALESESTVIDRARICRLTYEGALSTHVEKEELREELYANFYHNGAGDGKPTIILLGGSGGRFQTQTAVYLAAKGYPVLDLMYFGQQGLPPRLERVPLEYLERAVRFVKQRRETNSSAVVLMGRSRGAEYALLYASRFGEVDAVISIVGSNTVWSAKSYFRSPWTLEGKDIPFARGSFRQALGYLWRGRGVGQDQLSYFDSALSRPDRSAEIEVERISAPILLLSGQTDLQWPSAEMSERLLSRSAQHGSPHYIRHVRYDNAGHEFLALPFTPQPDFAHVMTWATGGTPQGNALAAIEAWGEIFSFLDRIQSNGLDPAEEGM